jgi:hypothetical protein
MWAPATGEIGGGVLPTPTTQEWKRRGPNSSQQGLSNTENWMLPTPVAKDDGKSPDAHLAMKARMKGGPRYTITSLAVLARNGMEQPTALPTPRACSAMASRLDTSGNLEGERFPNLETVVAQEMLPTPNAGEAKQSGNVQNWQRRQLEHAATGQDLQIPLAVAVKLPPTPTTNDSKNASLPPSQAERDGLAGAMLRDDSIPTGAATYLNPSFVEEMMGFPVGWTA